MSSEAGSAVFVYADVENFLRAQQRLASAADTGAVLQDEYFAEASPGLLMFIEKYDLTVERLTAALREHPEAYAEVGPKLAALRAQEGRFRGAYRDLGEVLGSVVFPPTYFVVAGHRGIGSGSVEGTLISIEKETPGSIGDDLVATLIHEMVHMQQLAALGEDYFSIFSGEEQTLLATSTREGAAMFFSELVTGGSVHKNIARDYLLAYETELWTAFQGEMLGHQMGDWLWQTPANPDQPQDVGYAIGARIVQAFYEAQPDKSEAVRVILSVTDYPTFLAKSRYGNAWKRPH